MNRIAVIGSGFAGLSAACFLAREGNHVTVIEKNDSPGGRARCFSAKGFTFDMGPSWYWMPDIFEKFFASFGKRTSDYYDLWRIDPSYRVIYDHQEHLDVPARSEALHAMFERIEPGSSRNLRRFLEESCFKYKASMHDLVFKPGISLKELVRMNLVRGAVKLHIFQSVASYVRKFFRDPRLIRLLEFPVLFLGSTPDRTPALYTLMNYADMELGTWYPMGGMNRVIRAMVDMAGSLGVNFVFNCSVERIVPGPQKAKGLVINGSFHGFDAIVAGADYHHVEQHLLPEPYRQYSAAYWDNRTLAPSALIFYLGVNKKIDGLLHHTLFFDRDLNLHGKEIYDHPQWPSAPLFYVSCPSKTDPGVAPAGMENLFILIPVAPGLEDTEIIRETYFEQVMNRLEKRTGQSIRNHIVYKRSYAHRNFIADYNAFKGNAYGLANTLWQTANFKPSIVNKKVPNLFYTGQLTIPGPGVPPSLISGEVVARELIKRQLKS